MIERFLGDAFGVLSCQFWSIVLQSCGRLRIHTVKRVCRILICCFLYSVFYSLLLDILDFSEIKFSIYFLNISAFYIKLRNTSTDSALALASVYRIHFDRKIRLSQCNHALNLLGAFS